MSLATFLRLGRVSNLPTVLSNTLLGIALVNARVHPAWALLFIAMLLFYVGGMFLNDAFDHRYDAQWAPARPIPQGQARVEQVYTVGALQLLIGVLCIAVASALRGRQELDYALPAAVALTFLIVLYDAWHKQNPLSPLLMAGCRIGVVLVAALATAGTIERDALYAALLVGAHVVGLTYAAKQEHLRKVNHGWPLLFLFAPALLGLALSLREPRALPWALMLLLADGVAVARLWRRAAGDVPQAVALLIAALSLLDGLLLALRGNALLAFACALCFAATLRLQRWVRGT